MDRAPVTVPIQTGLKVIDALIPIGRGQRELILGDRQTGKTAVAIDTILNQRGKDVLCVYCAIGQRASAVAKVVAKLRESGAMAYTVMVVAEGNDPPGLAYIAPYAATSIAEFFMEAGRDVLIVYDDLTHHARAYRELSLLLRRPPGREAFPGDIFYIHSRLLERATHLSPARVGARLDDATRAVITHGRRIRACLKQPEAAPIAVGAQIAVLLALTAGLFDTIVLEAMVEAEQAVRDAADQIPFDLGERLIQGNTLADPDREAIVALARRALAPLLARDRVKSQAGSPATGPDRAGAGQ